MYTYVLYIYTILYTYIYVCMYVCILYYLAPQDVGASKNGVHARALLATCIPKHPGPVHPGPVSVALRIPPPYYTPARYNEEV